MVREVIAIGREAKEIVGRGPRGVRAIRPLRDGVVVDLWTTPALLCTLRARAGTPRVDLVEETYAAAVGPRLERVPPEPAGAIAARVLRPGGLFSFSKR